MAELTKTQFSKVTKGVSRRAHEGITFKPKAGFSGKLEPRVRRDGMCRVCLGDRPDIAVLHEDPFCSSNCCRKYYQVKDTSHGAVANLGYKNERPGTLRTKSVKHSKTDETLGSESEAESGSRYAVG